MKRFRVEISQNDWEYMGYTIIKCNNIQKIGKNKVIADGTEIEFDEEIGEIKELPLGYKPYWDGYYN